jgi:hypothetical protein
MPEIKPILPVKAVIQTGQQPPVETVVQAHPPITAYNNTADPAVSGSNLAAGPGVMGKSAQGDAVHGESAGTNMSGVCGIHTAGGNGVYGRSSGNAGTFDGNVRVNGNLNVSGDIFLPGADVAEQFDVAGHETLAPGTLVVVDENGNLRASARAYDRAVAGVIAGAGSYRPGVILDSGESDARRARVSLIGKAYCFADASYGPIAVGDPLTSSATVGCAMKASDQAQAFGAIVGKALRPLAEGRELIPILVTLQ